MKKLQIILLVLALSIAAAADSEFVRAWEEAQRAKPRHVASVSRIASTTEPGSPLIIRGRVLRDQRPVADTVVFAWQTDASGVYDRPGSKPHSWRVRGWARTNADGRFTFHTIRPGSYPNGAERPHVHFSLVTTDGRRYFAETLELDAAPRLKRGTAEVAEITLQVDSRRAF